MGDPCITCNLPAKNHRIRVRNRSEYYKNYKKENPDKITLYNQNRKRFYDRVAVGIDGEGWTDPETGKHHYSYIAACTATEVLGEIHSPYGLRTSEIFDWLLSLKQPDGSLFVGFSIGYDITKWFENLPESTNYLLNHMEYRKGKFGTRPVRWDKFRIDRMSTRFTLRDEDNHKITIWDLFKFFGKAFVESLKDWNIGDQTVWDHIQAMKDKRGNFSQIGSEEQEYCKSECMLLASMCETLITAHKEAGIKLAQYYGPGSTASAMLKTMNAKAETAIIPEVMRECAEKAFFGGRFEISRAGPISGVYSYDIASAYPFAMTQLPCLKHGKWELVKKPTIQELENAVAACIHYRLPRYDNLRAIDIPDTSLVKGYVDISGQACTSEAWGPFPYRTSDGNILFPVVSEGGWLWKDEFFIGLKNFPNVTWKEAWILKQSCDCERPFANQIADYYNKRLEWGKEGRGIALKLGINSCYGKRAQRVGSAPYHCIVSAGMITSKCRAMLLEGVCLASNRWDIISLATDGIQATCELDLVIPPFTGTEETANRITRNNAEKPEGAKDRNKKVYPLGAWEKKDDGQTRNQHIIRPGMRFVPNSSKISDTAARGLGVRTLHQNREIVQEQWDGNICSIGGRDKPRSKSGPMTDVYIQQPTIFMGCKSSIRASTGARAALQLVRAGKATLSEIQDALYGAFDRDKNYGKWLKPEPRVVSYKSLPKRPMHEPGTYRLMPWVLDRASGESVAYGKAAVSALVKEKRELEDLEAEQPDRDQFPTPGEDGA